MSSLRRFSPPVALTFALALLALAVSARAHAMGAPASTTGANGTTTYVPSDGARAPSAAPNAGGTSVPAAGAATPATATPTPTGGQFGGARPATTARAGSTHISALAIVIAALGASLALACAAWALARRRALEPRWWLSLRHSVAEARHRASTTWAEFTDWVRLGH